MARSGVNPNVDSPIAEHTGRAEFPNATDESAREDIRGEARATAAALDDTLPMRSADARREVPRLRTDAANPNMDRKLPSPSAERGMLSSNRQKAYNKTKVAWVNKLPNTRLAAMRSTMGDREQLESVNRALHSTTGMRSELQPATRRHVESIDRAISDFEATNEREHVVYSVLKPPFDRQPSREALVRRLREMSDDERSMTFDSYIPASHSLGRVPESDDVVMEIRTRSGAYLGTSDTTPNSNHLVGRGRTLRPVGIHEVSYVKPDKTRGTRLVVQMEDVTQEERTTVN